MTSTVGIKPQTPKSRVQGLNHLVMRSKEDIAKYLKVRHGYINTQAYLLPDIDKANNLFDARTSIAFDMKANYGRRK